MKKFYVLASLLLVQFFTMAQLDQFTTILSPYFSRPVESGFMFFQTPNNLLPGNCFQYYKTNASDNNNDMVLTSVTTDSLLHFTHYKYLQTYKGLPVEGAGCIEHYNSQGSLIFTNAKHAVNLNINTNPLIPQNKAVEVLLVQLPAENSYAWNDTLMEQQIKIIKNNMNATFYPTPYFLLALDNYKDINFQISESRYTLAYKICVTTTNPLVTTTYYMNANTGNIFRTIIENEYFDGPASIYNYGTKTIDTQWKGGFTQKYILKTNDNNRNIHTKKKVNTNKYIQYWNLTSEVTDSDDQWWGLESETSGHYFVTIAWDFYKQYFNRNGLDGNNIELKVRTQWERPNAVFSTLLYPYISLGKTEDNWDYSMEPSSVSHEYSHGIIHYTSGLKYQFETGALNESFADIMGISIQALMLDNGSTDWIVNNSIPNQIKRYRSLSNPKNFGKHFTGNFDSNNYPIYDLGQPDTYLGEYWCDCLYSVDYGGVHLNSGVQNKWFYLLANGGNGTNDLNNNYNIIGIGIEKAMKITYYAYTSILDSVAQYSHARLATIQAAQYLYGACSQEYRSTVDAWYAVGVGTINTCSPLSINEISNNIKIYPNPTNSTITIVLNENQILGVVDIFNLQGKKIRTIVLNESNIINFEDLVEGVYIIQFILNDQLITKKIIFQK
jgi:Zn-dependent metalloprotease